MGGEKGMNGLLFPVDPVRGRRAHEEDEGHDGPVDAERKEARQVRLDAGSAARVRPGDREGHG